MKMKLAFIGIFLLLCFTFHGEVLVYEDIGFQVDVPDTWEVIDGNGSLMVLDPDEAAAVFLMPVMAEEFDDAVDQLEAMLGKIFEELEVSADPEEMELNSLPGIMAFGKGILEEEPVVWGLAIVYNEETDIALFTLIFVLAELYEEYEELILDILMSVSAAEEKAGKV